MRVFFTGIQKQFFVHLAAKTIFRKHAFYSSLHNHFRAAFDKILCGFFFFTTWVTRVVDVLLVMKFVTCKNNFISVYYYNIIAAIYVWCVIRFVLATKNCSDL